MTFEPLQHLIGTAEDRDIEKRGKSNLANKLSNLQKSLWAS